MGLIQKDATRVMIYSYLGVFLGFLNKGVLFLIILTPEQIGLVGLILSLGTLFANFSNLGVTYTTWKFLPFFKNDAKNHHGFLPFILSIVSVGILLCTSIYLIFQDSISASYLERSALFVNYYYWVLPLGILYVLYLVLEVYLRGFYKNTIAVIAMDVGVRVGTLLMLLLYWLHAISFDVFVKAHSLIYGIPTLILIAYLINMREFNVSLSTIQISKRFRKIIFRFSLVSYLNTLGMVLLAALDVIMIAQFVGLTGTGIYTTVAFLISATQVPYRSIARVSSPLVADYWQQRNLDKMRELYVNVSSVALVLGSFFFLVIWLNIDLLFSFLKPVFQEGIWVFFFLMIGRIFDMYAGLNGAIFSTSKKYKYEIWFTLLLIGLVYVLNLWLIPIYGIAGAAISTGATLILYNSSRLLFVWVAFKMHPFQRNQFIIVGLALCCLVTGMLMQSLNIHPWVLALVNLAILLTFFILPIVYFSLETNTAGYVRKIWSAVQQTLKLRKK